MCNPSVKTMKPYIMTPQSEIKWENASVVKEDDNKTLEELTKPLEKNKKDDLIIQDPQGHRYTISSDNIKLKNGNFPSAETNINFVFFDEKKDANSVKGRIVYADNVVADSEEGKVDLYGSNLLKGEEPVKVREVRKNIGDDKLLETLKSTSFDTIIIKTDNGKRFLFSANELGANFGSKLPEEGKKVEIGGIKGVATFVNCLSETQTSTVSGILEEYNKIEDISFISQDTEAASNKINI